MPIELVKLRFTPKLRMAMINTTWHPSQSVELQDDGSLIMTMKVRNTLHFRAWILGWGGDVEVLEPETLKEEILQYAKSVIGVYSQDAGFPSSLASSFPYS
jgi:predicted DNA-binding transcriptional regulator YafY